MRSMCLASLLCFWCEMKQYVCRKHVVYGSENTTQQLIQECLPVVNQIWVEIRGNVFVATWLVL